MKIKILERKIEEVKEYIKNDSLDKALSLMNIILCDKENSENNMVMLEMGQVLLARKSLKEARIWFEKVLKADEYNLHATKSMLQLFCHLEDYDNVHLYVEKIICKKEKFGNILDDMINVLFKNFFKCNSKNDEHNVKIIINILNICKEYIKDCSLKNILINEMEILNKKIILNSKPRNLIISTTSRCNIKCKMCVIPIEHWDFPHNKIHEIVQLFPFLQNIVWHGGEPFLYPYIDELIAEASKYNIAQIISTNGLLLNEERIKKIVNSKMELNISIHGITKEVYESIHCGGNFQKLLNNLEIIRNIKNESKVFMKYGLKFLAMKNNYQQLKNLYEFAVKYGFNHVYINTLGYDTINEENFSYHYKDINIIKNVIESSKILSDKFKETNIFYEAWLPDIEDVSDVIKHENENKQYEKKEQKFCCYMPWQSIQIGIDGLVRNNCYCENLVVGNINEESIWNIWNNDRIIKIRENIINKGFDERCALDCKNGRISRLYLKNRV